MIENEKTGRLMRNIIDQIKEAQIKLGYVKESVRLYYPVTSLYALLGNEETNGEKLVKMLNKEFEFYRNDFGEIEFFLHGKRMEVVISAQGAEYVHTQRDNSPFLIEIIELFRDNPHCSLTEICSVFERYSGDYKCEEMPPGVDFDYVLYFTDNDLDEYYYCIKEEMGHTIYHRFTREDFDQLMREPEKS